MEIWIVSYDDVVARHQGFRYAATRKEARVLARDWEKTPERSANVTKFDCPCTKVGMIDALNKYGAHNDNG